MIRIYAETLDRLRVDGVRLNMYLVDKFNNRPTRHETFNIRRQIRGARATEDSNTTEDIYV